MVLLLQFCSYNHNKMKDVAWEQQSLPVKSVNYNINDVRENIGKFQGLIRSTTEIALSQGSAFWQF